MRFKPCPNVICQHGRPQLNDLGKKWSYKYIVQCECCGASGEARKTEQEAADFWNTRPEDKPERKIDFVTRMMSSRHDELWAIVDNKRVFIHCSRRQDGEFIQRWEKAFDLPSIPQVADTESKEGE